MLLFRRPFRAFRLLWGRLKSAPSPACGGGLGWGRGWSDKCLRRGGAKRFCKPPPPPRPSSARGAGEGDGGAAFFTLAGIGLSGINARPTHCRLRCCVGCVPQGTHAVWGSAAAAVWMFRIRVRGGATHPTAGFQTAFVACYPSFPRLCSKGVLAGILFGAWTAVVFAVFCCVSTKIPTCAGMTVVWGFRLL